MELELTPTKLRSKSENRIRYESVVQDIRNKHGGLEDMRLRLGFSQKQMAELLLVDPSAWTRWVKEKESAPAHIYQALAWYFESREFKKADPITKVNWKMPEQSLVEPVSPAAWEIEKAILIDELRETQKKAVGVSDGWKLFLLINSVVLTYIVVSQIFSN